MGKKINPIITLDNFSEKMEYGGWRLEVEIETTNNNAIELTVIQPQKGTECFHYSPAMHKTILHNTSLKSLSNFGKEINKIANELIKQQTKRKGKQNG